MVREDRHPTGRLVLIVVIPQHLDAAGSPGAGAVALEVRPGAARSHQLAREHDQTRIDCVQIGVAKPELVHGAGRVVLDQRIASRDEVLEHAVAIGSLAFAPKPSFERLEEANEGDISPPVACRMKSG